MARGGRKDRPIDRSSGPVAELADDLRKLRGTLSLEEVGRRMGYHPSTVSRRLSPADLPPLEFVTAYVTACDGDPGPWEERWREIRRSVETTSAGTPPDDTGPVRPRRKPYILTAILTATAIAGGVAASAALWLPGIRGETGPPPETGPTALSTTSPGPATTGHGFRWTIERMTLRLLSRQWTQTAPGDIRIWARLTCPRGVTSYRIAVRPDGHTARFACGSWQYHEWAGVPGGRHHFEVWKDDDGHAVSGEGMLSSTVSIVELPRSTTSTGQ
ncbi:helix-turn-helix domain-containing protein [Nonomuraea lactucae]|uniref:helix-turn-helix domain-containing protein n=1 Tax=Nonomuraea lactucae TaxID=2249762 RepID=UPI000DE3D75D|nr:helix-turn-helix transcriptional regulator [Nonomuraea lactucae]